MSLKDVCAKLSTSGSKPTLSLVHKTSNKTIQEFFVVRATEQHRSFIIATWVKSYRQHAKKLGWGAFYDEHEPKIAESRWADSLVVTDEGGFTVYAWVCEDGSVLHHAYVAPELRRLGVTTALVAPGGGNDVVLAKPWPYRSKNFNIVNPYEMKGK